ncbi:MAG: alpha-hydroxy-acid oxidizing protein [Candidatus Handelsmanbacteria bacterium]|nr:alpha-hydroxy-acid oxidizing protein [Candidatus Handelsmanbacteria bacterium]
MQHYPTVADLRRRAQGRIPHVAWEYLETGTGDERGVSRNLEKMSEVTLLPRFMKGELKPDPSTTLLGRQYRVPFGVSPMGLSGLIWPRAELILARTAARYGFPYCMSTVATQTPETVGPLVGEMGWFQLYPPRERHVRADILRRAREAGFHTLVVTADVPVGSRRERTIRAGLRMPPVIGPRFVWEALCHPSWTLCTLQEGLPSLRTLEKYASSRGWKDVIAFVAHHVGGTLSWEYLKEVRQEWSGALVIKGLIHPADVAPALEASVDAIQVSNHGARQFDGTPSAIEALPAMVKEIGGRVPVLFDSGIRTGLDILRVLALGADFVFLGRAFLYAVAALGEEGGDLLAENLLVDLNANLVNLGCATLADIERLAPPQ